MIQLQLNLTDLDYDSLLDQYLPLIADKLRESGNPVGMLLSNGMPASMAKGIVHGLPQGVKESLTADLVNSHAAQVTKLLQDAAAKKGIALSLDGLHAEVKK